MTPRTYPTARVGFEMQVNEPERRNGVLRAYRSLPISLQGVQVEAPSPLGNDTVDDQDVDLEGQARHESESTLLDDGLPPPLGVKITGYRLLYMSVVFAFGLAKAILTYKGQSAMPTTLDWISGAFLGVCLYFIGLYEPTCPKKWEWFFQIDLTRAIYYCFLRFIGGVAGVLFALHGTLAITSLTSVPVFLIAHFIPRVPLDLWLGVYLLFTACVHLAWLRTRRLRGGARARQAMMGFLEVHGLRASLPGKYEWFGTVGVTLGFFCGIALICSPLTFVYFSL